MDVQELTQELIAVPSVSGNEKAISKHIYDYLTDKDAQPIKIDDNIVVLPKTKSPFICFEGHMDTVPGDVPLKVDGDKLYGLGASDMKGALACMLTTLSDNCMYVFVTDEEVNSAGAFKACAYLEKGGLMGKIKGVIIGEPSDGNIITSSKGAAVVKIETRGKSCHSSTPEKGENAIDKMLLEVEKFKKSTKGMIAPIAVLKGGVKSNIIPDSCIMESTVRFGAEIKDLNEFKKKVGNFPTYHFMAASETSEKCDFVKKLKQLTGMETGTFPFTTDGNCFSKHGIPTIVGMGPGNTESMHSPNEWVSIRALKHYCALYKKIGETI